MLNRHKGVNILTLAAFGSRASLGSLRHNDFEASSHEASLTDVTPNLSQRDAMSENMSLTPPAGSASNWEQLFECALVERDPVAREQRLQNAKDAIMDRIEDFLLQRRTEEKRKSNGQSVPPMLDRITPDGIGRASRGINDGKGFVFVSHLGEVFPSGFLPISAGNVRTQSLTELYRHSPLFVSLRDSANLKGKCRVCEFREVCGGSRARAHAVTGDLFAEEPCCTWQPKSVFRTEDRSGRVASTV